MKRMTFMMLFFASLFCAETLKAQKVVIWSEGKAIEYVNVDSITFHPAEPDDFNATQWMSFIISGKECETPSFLGNNPVWKINWGDGTASMRNGSEKHLYETDEKHEVTIKQSGIQYFRMPLKGVETIDISKFR